LETEQYYSRKSIGQREILKYMELGKVACIYSPSY
jgi:hypothetical protein